MKLFFKLIFLNCVFSALEEAWLLVVSFKLEVHCYVAKDIPVMYAVSKLIIHNLVQPLNRTSSGKTIHHILTWLRCRLELEMWKCPVHILKYQQDFNSKAHSKMQRTVPLCIFWIIWQERSSSVFFLHCWTPQFCHLTILIIILELLDYHIGSI